MKSVWLPILALGAGVSFVVQQSVNARLRVHLESAVWSGFVSYAGGTLCMVLLALVMRESFPSMSAMTRSNWWEWMGGLFGAIYIGISILLMPRLGTAAFVALFVTGQMLYSVAADHYGLFGATQHSVTPLRFLGAALLIAGAILVRR